MGTTRKKTTGKAGKRRAQGLQLFFAYANLQPNHTDISSKAYYVYIKNGRMSIYCLFERMAVRLVSCEQSAGKNNWAVIICIQRSFALY